MESAQVGVLMDNFLAHFVTHYESCTQDVKTGFGDQGFIVVIVVLRECETLQPHFVFFPDNSEILVTLQTQTNC